MSIIVSRYITVMENRMSVHLYLISLLDVPDLKKVHFVRQITRGLNHSWKALLFKLVSCRSQLEVIYGSSHTITCSEISLTYVNKHTHGSLTYVNKHT